MTLFRKPAEREDGELGSQRTILPELRVQTSFIFKGEGVWLIVAHFLVPESFVLAAVHVGQVRMFL